jgi:hypothetical protein
MRIIVEKLILETTLAQNFISFYIYTLEICLKTQELFLIMLGKNCRNPTLG